jgi:MFS transporter, PPP family, 3-phenylpropionic acid transporter
MSEAASLKGFYALYFGSVGVILPFLPAYLKSLSLSGAKVGSLLALPPLLSLIAPPIWGHLADRLRRPARILQVISFGVLIAFSPLLAVEQFGPLVLTMALYAFFSSSITPIIDTVTLEHVARSGGSYARIRLYGSLGFVLTSMAFGVLVRSIDRRTVVVPLFLMAGYALWSLILREGATGLSPPNPLAGLKLLRQADVATFLAATCLHWIACTPYHGTFSIHVKDLHLSPWVVGLSAGIGVFAETCVMYAYPRFADRLSPPRLLFVSCFVSVLRWLGMSLTSHAWPIIMLSVLHGMTFGAFYISSVGYMAIRVPRNMRASGQALFASITFGLGGLLGYLASGIGYDSLGGHRLFFTAAIVDLAAALLALGVKTPVAATAEVGVTPALG